MIDPVRELKVRAEVLHHAVSASNARALERLRTLVELRAASVEALRVAAPAIRRKHCLLTVSREAGFSNWEHARRVLEGDPAELDFGTLLYGPPRNAAHLNAWFSTYDEAREAHASPTRESEGRYLLAYKRQFFLAGRGFVAAGGIDPDDVDWEHIGWDWVRPRSADARRRLYGKLLTAQRRLAA